MGEVLVERSKYWGAQTQRHVDHSFLPTHFSIQFLYVSFSPHDSEAKSVNQFVIRSLENFDIGGETERMPIPLIKVPHSPLLSCRLFGEFISLRVLSF